MAGGETYSVSFATTKLGSICTGYRLTMAGAGTLSSGIKGVSGGILIAKGQTLRRDYEADTETYCDPIFKQLNGTILVYPTANTGMKNGAFVMDPGEVQAFFTSTIGVGNVMGFLSAFLTTSNITLGKSSPVMDALSGGAIPDSVSQTINQAVQVFGIGSIISVQDVLQTYLPVLGVEMYWDGGDNYVIEPPRILDSSKTKGSVSREDIIEKTIGSDVFNIPDVVMPRFPSPAMINKQDWDNVVMQGLLGITGVARGSDYLKITIFDVPAIHANSFAAGVLTHEKQAGLTTGVLPSVYKGLSDGAISFYQNLGFSSAMYGIASGTIVCRFQAGISIPAAWYNIDGEKLFVSDIRHEISRFRAVTILTIAATEDSIKGMPTTGGGGGGGGGGGDDQLSSSISKVKKGDREAKSKRSKAAAKIHFHPKEGKHSITDKSSGEIKIGKVLPDKKIEKAKITGTIAAIRISK